MPEPDAAPGGGRRPNFVHEMMPPFGGVPRAQAEDAPLQPGSILVTMHVVDNDAGTRRRHGHPFLPLERPAGVFVAALPMLAHRGAGKLVVLGVTLVGLLLIDDVEDRDLGVEGHAEICQLVAYNLTDITVRGSWLGPGRLHLVPHVNAPVADFPVWKIVGAHHFVADVTLPYGRVLYDYNKARA